MTDGAAASSDGLVGRVIGTEDATPLQFAVALGEGSYLQLDDVVVTVRQVPGVGPVMTSGVVTQVRARHEGASFGSDVFLISEGVLPAQVQEIAEVSTTRVEPEVHVAAAGGAGARASGAELGPGAVLRSDGRPGSGRARLGRVAHLPSTWSSWTGPGCVRLDQRDRPSGDKTSFARLSAALDLPVGVLGAGVVNAKALVFSVKGEDLLFLDTPNVHLDDDLRAAYAQLGLPAEPFASVTFYAPPIPEDQTGRPNVTRADQRGHGVLVDAWPSSALRTCCATRSLMPRMNATSTRR